MLKCCTAMATGRSEGKFRFSWGGWGGRRAGGNACAAPAPLAMELVYALVLERESRNAGEAKVLFAKRDYWGDQHGDPIMTIAQLTDAVMAHIGHPQPYRSGYDGEPLVFGEDPRESGDPEDDTDAPSKRLKEVQKLKGKLDPTRRGDAGEQNPYFVLVTRGPDVNRVATLPSSMQRLQIPAPEVHPAEIIKFVLDELCTVRREEMAIDSTVTDEFHSSHLPFVGRVTTLRECHQLIGKRYTSHRERKMEKNFHSIGVLGGASGIGKSRALLEAASEVEAFANEMIATSTDEKQQELGNQHAEGHIEPERPRAPWVANVLITYGNDNSPATDRALPSARVALALRILFFAFRRYMPETCKMFNRFVQTIRRRFRGTNALAELATRHVLSAIAEVMDRVCGVPGSHGYPGFIYIGVDETNFLLEGGAADPLLFLTNTMQALRDVMLDASASFFVFIIVAGTAALPLQVAFRQSGASYQFISMPLLRPRELFALMESLAVANPVWEGWHNDARFRQLLLDYGAFPILLDELLKKREQVLNATGDRCCSSTHQVQLQSMISFSEDLAVAVAYQLVEDMILQTPIKRGHPVDGGEYKKEVEHKKEWTYEGLESCRRIILEGKGMVFRVQLIWPVLRALAIQASRKYPAAARLLDALSLLPKDPMKGIVWQNFEEFCTHYQAAREMFLFNRTTRKIPKTETVTVKLRELYAGGLMSDTVGETLVKLSANVDIASAQHRFPESFDIRDADGNARHWHDCTMYVKNADGAKYDTFGVREIAKAGSGTQRRWLNIAGQQKAYVARELNLQQLNAELTKAADAHTALQQALQDKEAQCAQAIGHVLVVYATRVAEDVSGLRFNNIPENCILLCGQRMRWFFGDLLCGRAFTALTGDVVNVNTATEAALRAVNGIDEGKHRRITSARRDRPFTSLQEFSDRTGIRSTKILTQLEVWPEQDPSAP